MLIPINDLKPVNAGNGEERRWRGHVLLPGTEKPTELLVIACGERLRAVHARCPHAGAKLYSARLRWGEALECPMHGLLIPLDDGWPVTVQDDDQSLHLVVAETSRDAHAKP